MKIQCEVCDKQEASVFCPSDEAALCHGCDHSIHHANKLASKHKRFSLLQPTCKEFPLCDICQERRAFLFCREDRAILCRECDIPIHKATEHTQKHNRFLLTGVKLADHSFTHQTSSSCSGANKLADTEVTRRSNSSAKSRKSVSNEVLNSASMVNSIASTGCSVEDIIASDTASVSTSSISEYLIETLPGWCFEDLLDHPFESHGLCKKNNHQCASEDECSENCTFSFPSDNLTCWVPQLQLQSFQNSSQMIPMNGFLNGALGDAQEKTAVENSWNRLEVDDGFTVPQMSPLSIKKRRHF